MSLATMQNSALDAVEPSSSTSNTSMEMQDRTFLPSIPDSRTELLSTLRSQDKEKKLLTDELKSYKSKLAEKDQLLENQYQLNEEREQEMIQNQKKLENLERICDRSRETSCVLQSAREDAEKKLAQAQQKIVALEAGNQQLTQERNAQIEARRQSEEKRQDAEKKLAQTQQKIEDLEAGNQQLTQERNDEIKARLLSEKKRQDAEKKLAQAQQKIDALEAGNQQLAQDRNDEIKARRQSEEKFKTWKEDLEQEMAAMQGRLNTMTDENGQLIDYLSHLIASEHELKIENERLVAALVRVLDERNTAQADRDRLLELVATLQDRQHDNEILHDDLRQINERLVAAFVRVLDERNTAQADRDRLQELVNQLTAAYESSKRKYTNLRRIHTDMITQIDLENEQQQAALVRALDERNTAQADRNMLQELVATLQDRQRDNENLHDNLQQIIDGLQLYRQFAPNVDGVDELQFNEQPLPAPDDIVALRGEVVFDVHVPPD